MVLNYAKVKSQSSETIHWDSTKPLKPFGVDASCTTPAGSERVDAWGFSDYDFSIALGEPLTAMSVTIEISIPYKITHDLRTDNLGEYAFARSIADISLFKYFGPAAGEINNDLPQLNIEDDVNDGGTYYEEYIGTFTFRATVAIDADPGGNHFGLRVPHLVQVATQVPADSAPEGDFVIGGGWFDSPQESYRADPLLEGKANFGFVSKYKKGATIPTGNTEFQFQEADLNFHSDQYDSLVVTDSTAEFTGLGTINGLGAYEFKVAATDGSPDTFRIQIWDEDSTLIYDNQFGTAIGGGNIVIHKAK